MESSALKTTSEEAGQTQPLAQTTQFAPPVDCAVWALTPDGRGYQQEYFYSDPGDARFTTCQPSGWAARPESQRFNFSPAVCPSEWTWHSMRLVSVTAGGNYNITMALCCAADFTPALNYNSQSSAYIESCRLDFGHSATAATTSTVSLITGPVSTVTDDVFIHEAWWITRRETDQAILTPVPPSMTGGTTLIFSWDGKATSIDDGDALKDNGSETGDNGVEIVALAFILPICVVLAIGLFVFWSRWSLKKEAREQE